MTRWIACLVGVLSLHMATESHAAMENPHTRPIVGAIRWDGWFAGNPWEKYLAPKQWRDRLPFYSRIISDDRVEIRSDSQAVMDREIAYARKGGLDFWAFCYYHPTSWHDADRYNYGWRLFRSSKHKRGLHFCLLLQGGRHMGSKEDWPNTAASFVEMFRDPAYQRVLNGRPLLFIFSCENIEKQFGSPMEARAAFDDLRRRSISAGAGSPYIVAQVISATDGAHYVDTYHFDAISAYSAPGGNEPREHPYAELALENRGYWDRFRATGKPVVPTVNAGWDGRPRLVDPSLAGSYAGPWYTQPTPAELADNLRDALKWNADNPKAAAANAVLIYAWNESDEGGWLVPTKSEGDARLKAIASVLRYERKDE
jgi:hypothetical protein